jgi:hypothetical protein
MGSGSWTQPVAQTSGPGSSFGTGLSAITGDWDPIRHQILFWGNGSGSNQLWSFSPTTNVWAHLNPSGTPPTGVRKAVWDDFDSWLLLYSGGGTSADVVAYDPVANAWIALTASGGVPVSRYYPAMAWDSTDRVLLMFGGGPSYCCNSSDYGDLWQFSPATRKWTQLSTTGAPGPRHAASGVWDSQQGVFLVIDGSRLDKVQYYDELWTYSPSKGQWQQVDAAGTHPEKRDAASAAYDSATGNTYLFGGSDDDVWLNSLSVLSIGGGQTPVIPGSAWHGDGVTVCYPAGDRSSDYCGGQHYVVGDPRDSQNNPLGWWQCVELAQRFYKSHGWTWPDATTSSGTFIGVGGAADIKTWAKSIQASTGEVSWHDNGSGYVPRAGDLIVTDRSAGNYDAGHVSIVDSTDTSKRKIKVVEQNHSPTGWAQYSYGASGQIARDGYINPSSVVVNDDSTLILGTVHVEKSSTTATPAAGASVNLPGGTQLAIGSGAAASSGTLALSSFDASNLPDPLPSGLQLSGDGASVTLPTLSSGSSATLSFSYDPSSIPSGWTLSIYQDGDWTALPTTLSNGIASAQVSASTGYALLVSPTHSTYVPLTPVRLVDSRSGAGQTGLTASLVHDTPASFIVTGRAGIPANAVAVTGNLTVTNQTSFGYLSLTPTHPTGTPATSTLNFPTGDNRANAVVVPLGSDGAGRGVLWLTYEGLSAAATTDVIFDATGYFVPDDTGSTYVPVTPTRFVDSRAGTGQTGLSASLAYNAPVSFRVSARTDTGLSIPDNAVAVTGNLTVTNQSSFGYFSLTPTQPSGVPGTSTLNFPTGDNRANAVVVPLGIDGSGHRVIWITYEAISSSASADVVFDVTGYFVPDASGAYYVPVTPNRLVDSRPGADQSGLSGSLSYNAPASFVATDRSSGVAAANVPASAVAVTGNLTVTNQTSFGYLSLTPSQPGGTPSTSTLNFPVGDNRANAVIVPLGLDGTGHGTLWITYEAVSPSASTDAVFDVTGYFVK